MRVSCKTTLVLAALVLLTCQAHTQEAPTVFKPTAEFSQRVMKAFRQGQDNDFNCASLALVKLALATYGPETLSGSAHEGAFISEEVAANGNHHIALQKGPIVDITADELAAAASQSGFTVPVSSANPGDAALRDRANLLYAVMAKRAIEIHDSNPRFHAADNYSDAIGLLQKGRNFEELAPLLGLVADEVADGESLPSLKDNLAYVFTNNWHAVFSSGDQYDEYGDPQTVDSFNAYHHPRFRLFGYSKENWVFTISTASPNGSRTAALTLSSRRSEGATTPFVGGGRLLTCGNAPCAELQPSSRAVDLILLARENRGQYQLVQLGL